MKPLSTFQRVYEIVRQIPSGKVTTYGQIACLLGNPRMARVVGFAMRACKEADSVPWHRVVDRQGEFPVESSIPGAGTLQREMLIAEGVGFTADGRVDLRRFQWYGEE